MSETRASGTGATLRQWTSAIEQQSVLDPLSKRLAGLGELLGRAEGVRRALRGEWLGHALHPLLTDFPLGTWMSASLLDLFGPPESRDSAQLLLTFGCLAAIPTATAGVIDYADADASSKRVGVLHAAINSTALLLYGSSLLARRRDRHRVGKALGIAGGLTATVGGYFGGHLSYVRGTGVEHRR
jgi:uncharacterized membrane protein